MLQNQIDRTPSGNDSVQSDPSLEVDDVHTKKNTQKFFKIKNPHYRRIKNI